MVAINPGDLVLIKCIIVNRNGAVVISDECHNAVAMIICGPHRRPEPWSEWYESAYGCRSSDNIFTICMENTIGYTWDHKIIEVIK